MKLRIYFFVLITFISSLFGSNYVVIQGSLFRLDLYDSEDILIRSYPIGIGKNGMGKTKEGDQKTPVGEYEILWKASRFAQEDGGYLIEDDLAFCGPNNIFTKDPKIGYEEEALWKASYGGDKAVVLCLNYPNRLDVERGYTGVAIEIHATLLGGVQKCSSAGCIRMLPEDARDLYNQVDVGSKVFIFP